MAIFAPNPIRTVSRAKAKKATFSAGYATRQDITDERTGEQRYYGKHQDLVDSGVVLPSDLENPPDWANDIQQLANQMELSQKRINACTARTWMLPLPHELNTEQRKELARDCCQWLADRHSIAVIYGLHEPHQQGDSRNHHLHMVMSTRQIQEKGFRTAKSQKVNGKSQYFIPLDYGETKGGAEITAMREAMCNLFKEHLSNAGFADEASELSHLSYEERGLEQKSQTHLGEEATALERQGIETEKGNYNRWVQSFNAQLIEKYRQTINHVKEYLQTYIVDYFDRGKENITDMYRHRSRSSTEIDNFFEYNTKNNNDLTR